MVARAGGRTDRFVRAVPACSRAEGAGESSVSRVPSELHPATMSILSIFGAQWGDEGKGKIIDLLARDADYVVRYQGGANAGHTVVVDGQKFILRLVPSGVLHPGKVNVVGNGVAVDPLALFEELD